MLRSNGLGSLQQLIAVPIDNRQASKLLEIQGVKLLEQGKDRTLVQYPMWTTRCGDDETVVYELRYRFSAMGIFFEDWSIN